MISKYITLFLQLLDEEGVDSDAILRSTGMTIAQLQEHKQQWLLVRAGMRAVKSPELGLRFGQRININDHGVFGYAMLSSATIGDALNLLMRYHRILVPELSIDLHTGTDWVALRCHATQFPADLERFSIDSFFTAMITSAAALDPSEDVAIVQQFHFAAPEDITPYQLVFGESVEFDAPYSQTLVQRARLDTPISSANASVEAIFRAQCDVLLQQMGEGEVLSSRVQHILLHRRGEFPEVAQVALQLNMSESTLRRRLKNEGTGFRQLLDRVRFHLARQYLMETNLPAAEIGYRLGFDDAANFRRAFARWSGTTPSQLRQQGPFAKD